MTKKQTQVRAVKAWAAIAAASDNLLAYGERGGDWTYAVSAHKRALEAITRKESELVVRRYVPCTITYTTPKRGGKTPSAAGRNDMTLILSVLIPLALIGVFTLCVWAVGIYRIMKDSNHW